MKIRSKIALLSLTLPLVQPLVLSIYCALPAAARHSADSEYINVDDDPPPEAKTVRRPVQPSESAPIHSRSVYADVSGPVKPSSMTLKAGASYTVPRGTGMNLKIVSVPTHGMKLLDKDLEGNPVPAKVGDVIVARISEDIFIDGESVIPEGTVFRGHVVHLNGPRRVQRPGWVDISFNELELPDHRIFRFAAQADNLEKSTPKSKMRGVGMVAANAAGGAIVGAMAAYYFSGGLHNTVSMHGYNIAAGAAGGAILAAGHAIMKKGHSAWLEPGDGLNINIDNDMIMPALTAPTKHVAHKNYLQGLEIKVLSKPKIVKDGIGGHFVCMDVNIYNGSTKTLESIDLNLVDVTGTRCPLSMGPEDDNRSEFLFHLLPGDSLRSKLYFASEHPKLGHDFVWYDHNNHEICFRQKLEI
ncbi:MAG: hypothetical protein KGS72_03900 [Cyanobacteria bacterium REEB67]|nr:hypothetical protein [Cyanobacteria bacterium REEB67]